MKDVLKPKRVDKVQREQSHHNLPSIRIAELVLDKCQWHGHPMIYWVIPAFLTLAAMTRALNYHRFASDGLRVRLGSIVNILTSKTQDSPRGNLPGIFKVHSGKLNDLQLPGLACIIAALRRIEISGHWRIAGVALQHNHYGMTTMYMANWVRACNLLCACVGVHFVP